MKSRWSLGFGHWSFAVSVFSVFSVVNSLLGTWYLSDCARRGLLLSGLLFVLLRPFGQVDNGLVDRRLHVVQQRLRVDAEEDRQREQRGCDCEFAAGHGRKRFRMRALVFGAEEYALNGPEDVTGG